MWKYLPIPGCIYVKLFNEFMHKEHVYSLSKLYIEKNDIRADLWVKWVNIWIGRVKMSRMSKIAQVG